MAGKTQSSAPADAEPVPIDAPLFFASTTAIVGISNEIILVFSRGRPVIGTIGGEQVMLAEPQVMVSISPQTAKDLLVVLQGVVETYEKDGPIETDFTRKRQAKAE